MKKTFFLFLVSSIPALLSNSAPALAGNKNYLKLRKNHLDQILVCRKNERTQSKYLNNKKDDSIQFHFTPGSPKMNKKGMLLCALMLSQNVLAMSHPTNAIEHNPSVNPELQNGVLRFYQADAPT